MKIQRNQGFTLIELLVVITIIAILASLAVPTFSKIQERGNMTKGVNNCRQIITTLRIYSSDNNGNYPDNATVDDGSGGGGGAVTTANDAFRQLFVGGQATDEKIFGCPASANGNPDGNIGTAASSFTEAVKAGENHWAMTANLNDSASGSIPLVFENPVSGGANPTWDTDAAGRSTAGRTWSGGKVIVGMNDSSVAPLTCVRGGGAQPLQKQGSGDNPFEAASKGGSEMKTLDILKKS